MAAFNWILFDEKCPSCGKLSSIKAQFHIASSFHGNESGRFCNRIYRLNDEIEWMSKTDQKWATWSDRCIDKTTDSSEVQECCYANCENCGADLFAVVVFKPIKAIAISQIGLEIDWPQNITR